MCRYAWLGAMDYHRACQLQVSLVNAVHDGHAPNTLLLLEHPHVYTRGRLSRNEHLLTPEGDLAALGVPVYETDRGGQITYHGPGQVVGYPIINLKDWGGGPLKYVRTLEQIMVSTLSDLGVAAHTEEGLTGVWTAGGKIAAIGVKVSRGVAFHGFAVNVNTDLSYYRHIVPCGITDRPVTSLAEELNRPVAIECVRRRLAHGFGLAMGLQMVEGLPQIQQMA